MRAVSLALLFAAGLFWLVGAGAAQQADDESRVVLRRAIEAHGGAELLTKITGGRTRSKGKIEILGGAEFSQQTAIQYPNKFRDEMELEVGGQRVKVITIWDGTNGSIEANGQKVPVNDDIKDTLRKAADAIAAMRLVGLSDKGNELSPLGEAQVNDQPAVGVRVARKDQPDLNLYFDKKSGLMTKMEHRVRDQLTGQEVTEERIVQEYQKVDGMPVAKRVLVNRDGKRFIEAEVLEVKLLEKIDDGEFALP